MTLLTNGCSWTWGIGLDAYGPEYYEQSIRERTTWPGQLASLMNASNVINLSIGCGSNQRIVRTTIDWILAQNRKDMSDVTAVIQWTHKSRYEYYYPDDVTNIEENLQHRWVRCNVGSVVVDCDINEKMANKYNNDRMRTYTDIEGAYSFLTQCETLVSLFNRHSIKYYFWNNIPDHIMTPNSLRDFMLKNYRWLNVDDAGMPIFWDYERIFTGDQHPSPYGHSQLAKAIYQSINRINDK
jgi:hypothetical protein